MWTSKATREIQIETIFRFDTMSVSMTTIKKINGEGLGRQEGKEKAQRLNLNEEKLSRKNPG